MRRLTKYLLAIKGKLLKASLDRATKNPHQTQKDILFKIIKENLYTEYGQRYGFKDIHNENDFKKQVPINQYKDLEGYIEKIKNGHKNILTARSPFMFNLTSGTSDKPKYIPIIVKGQELTANLIHQWLYRILLGHPDLFDGFSLYISSSAIEGYTSSGIPCGSTSGMIYKTLPQTILTSCVLPFMVSDIKNNELKYYIMARLALEKDISFIATPNAMTLIKIAETCIHYQEGIVHAINDGSISQGLHFDINKNDSKIVDQLKKILKPNPVRAKFLADIIGDGGKLLPRLCWPNLKLISCWLGGSAGFQVEKLKAFYDEAVPMRDPGYLASEGSITIPFRDSTPAGILALQNNYYEFIPEDQFDQKEPKTLLSHELEKGKCYKILLTNINGLYRYDINDIIQVQDFYNEAPVLAFIRKSDDILNITGEKLHVNHFLLAFKEIEPELNIVVNQFRAVPNFEKNRYEIYADIAGNISKDFLKTTFIPSIDKLLSKMNIEYLNKRKSKRLNPPCLHVMDPSWEDSIKQDFIRSGKRDIQYKWQTVSAAPLDLDKKHIKYTVEM